MAVNLSIKNVPEDIAEKLRERARRHHRSLQGELLAVIEESVTQERLTPQEVFERTNALGLRTPDEATKWVREDRDRAH